LDAEIRWLSSVIDDLEQGRLDWSEDLLRAAMDGPGATHSPAKNPPDLPKLL
jgi:hypothetical protein